MKDSGFNEKNKQSMNHPWNQKGIESTRSKNQRLPVGLSKLRPFAGKRELEEIDPEETRDYFVNLYRNCKE